MKSISFISPSRNNLSYLKWMYNSIRKNLGYTHEIMLADDFSSDDTWEWLQEIEKKSSTLFEKSIDSQIKLKKFMDEEKKIYNDVDKKSLEYLIENSE